MFALAKSRIYELRRQFLQQRLSNYAKRGDGKTSRIKPCARSEALTHRRRREISTQKAYIKPKNEVEANQMNHYTINIYVNAVSSDQINAGFPREVSAMIPMDFSVDKLTKNIPVIEGLLKDKDLEKDKEVIEEKMKDFWINVLESGKDEEEKAKSDEVEVKELEAKIGLKNTFDFNKIKTYGDYLENGEALRVDKDLKLPPADELKFEKGLEDDPEDKNVLKAPVPFYERGSYDSRSVRPKKIISSAGQVRRKLSKEAEETNKQVESLLKLSTQTNLSQEAKESVFGRVLRYFKSIIYGEDEVKEKDDKKDKEIDPEKLAHEKFLERKRLQEEEAKRVEEEKRIFQSYLRTFQEKYRENEENEAKQSGFFKSLKERFLNKKNNVNNESKRSFSTNSFNPHINLINKQPPETDLNAPKFFYDQKIRQNPIKIKNKTFFNENYENFLKVPTPKIISNSKNLKLEREKQLKYEQLKKLQSKVDFAKKNLKLEVEEKQYIAKLLKQKRNLMMKTKNEYTFDPSEKFAINFEEKTEKEIKLKCEDLKKSKEIGENLEMREIRRLIEAKMNRKIGLIERKNNNKQTITFFKRNLSSNDCPTSKKLIKRKSIGPKEPLKYAQLKSRKENDCGEEISLKKPEIISTEIPGLYDTSGDKSYESYFGVGGYRNKEFYSYKKTSYYDLMDAMSLGRVEQPKNPIKPR
nr:uncharacterized protein LOC111415405 isoform X1 [Onthophagus taurus]